MSPQFPLIIGEWCLDPMSPKAAALTPEQRRRFYRSLAGAQLAAWAGAAGWFFWNYKLLIIGSGLDGWDLGKSIELGCLPGSLGPGRRRVSPRRRRQGPGDSAGLVIMGQWPESMSARSRCLASRQLGYVTGPIHYRAWGGVNWGRRARRGHRIALVHQVHQAPGHRLGDGDRSRRDLAPGLLVEVAASGPWKGPSRGKGMNPSFTSKKSASGLPV